MNLLNNDEVSLAELANTEKYDGEIELVPDIEQVKQMSLAMQHENKKELTNLRNNVLLKLDKKKMQEVEDLSNAMDSILGKFQNIDDVQITNAFDLKVAAEAYAKLNEARQKSTRLDTIDGTGTAAKIKLGVQFQSSDGTKVQTFIETGD